MYENITDPKACIDAINGSLGWSHAEQAAYLYEECESLLNYNSVAVQEIIDYLNDNFPKDYDAQEIVRFGEEIMLRMNGEGSDE